jgi:predicted transcriptional regulator
MSTGVEMESPRGILTFDQMEIMHIFWAAGRPLTSAEVWHELAREKAVARTTVITLVKRLASRGWLSQEGSGRGARFSPTCAQEATSSRLTQDFLDKYFEGSPSRFVMNLLGSQTVSKAEADELRQLLDDYGREKNVD